MDGEKNASVFVFFSAGFWVMWTHLLCALCCSVAAAVLPTLHRLKIMHAALKRMLPRVNRLRACLLLKQHVRSIKAIEV
jgi:hypothetical protein